MPSSHRGLTLVELLVTIAITLLIMSAVVTVFSNVSGSVSRRRATIEMASQLRNVRQTLARDLAGATCPAVPTQRPESNVGYLEIIEGPFNDHYPSPLIYNAADNDNPGTSPVLDAEDIDGIGDPIGGVAGIDLELSTLPSSNLGADIVSNEEGTGLFLGANLPLPEAVKTDGRGLGDGDDILMLTVRNETAPFVGRIPPRTGVSTPANSSFATWFQLAEEVESTLAEVVWFAVENPVDPNRTFAFGEAGYRNIYRRALLILPGLDYEIPVSANGRTVQAEPGVVRVLGQDIGRRDVSQAIASLIAFQERFDLSVRLEWNPLLPDSIDEGNGDELGRWVLQANTLSDLTRRENRYEHHGYVGVPQTLRPTIDRFFPFAVATAGRLPAGTGSTGVLFVVDPELSAATGRPGAAADFTSQTATLVESSTGEEGVIGFLANDGDVLLEDRQYDLRPFAIVNNDADFPAAARAILNEDGNVVHVTRGLAPLGGARRGDDLMMTDALAFDLKVYDPGAPIYAYFIGGDTSVAPDQVVTPTDPAWLVAYERDLLNDGVGINPITNQHNPVTNASYPFRIQGQGTFVDLGYGSSFFDNTGANRILGTQRFAPRPLADFAVTAGADLVAPRFTTSGVITTGVGVPLTSLYRTFDTWSSHYESDGVNQDFDLDENGAPIIDEGTNGLDDRDPTLSGEPRLIDNVNDVARFGPDDLSERETLPPYDTALRGLQVTLRVYERDSRQIREVSVVESFVPE